ncbi:MAG: hypothetical protein Alpg2KO_10650 [Alphaproteobacteria bacterium]
MPVPKVSKSSAAHSSDSQFLSGTVVEIIDHGVADGAHARPWQARVVQGDGTHSLVSAIAPLDCDVGDDLHANGVWQSFPASTGLDPRFAIDEPEPVMNRLRGLTETGAEIRSFGATAAQTAQPGFIASLAGAVKRAVPMPLMAMLTVEEGERKRPQIATILKRGEQDDDLGWLQGLANQVPDLAYPVIAIDPLAFTPRSTFGEKLERAASLSKRASSRLIQSFSNLLPEMAADEKMAFTWSSVVHSKPSMSPHGQGRALIITHDPYATSLSELTEYASLDAAVHVPRDTVDPQIRKSFVAAHELAHALQSLYGVDTGGGADNEHLGEQLADAFAILANAQRHGSTEPLEPIVTAREVAPLGGLYSHATGRSCRAAQALANDWISSGEMAGKTADDFMREAVRIAHQNQLSAEEKADIGALADHHAEMPVTRRLELVEQGGASGSYWQSPMLKQAAAAYRKGFYDQRDLANDAALREQTFAAYALDCKQTILAFHATRTHGNRFRAKESRIGGLSRPGKESALTKDQFALHRQLHGPRKQILEGLVECLPNAKDISPRQNKVSLIGRPSTLAGVSEVLALPFADRVERYVSALSAEAAAVNKAIGTQDGDAAHAEAASKRRNRVMTARAIVLAAGANEAIETLPDFLQSAILTSASQTTALLPDTRADAAERLQIMADGVVEMHARTKLKAPEAR